MKTKTKAAEDMPVTQTVKLEEALFVRLKTFSAETRRTNQNILREALVEYLEKNEGMKGGPQTARTHYQSQRKKQTTRKTKR